jgi:hypothetical protein
MILRTEALAVARGSRRAMNSKNQEEQGSETKRCSWKSLTRNGFSISDFFGRSGSWRLAKQQPQDMLAQKKYHSRPV